MKPDISSYCVLYYKEGVKGCQYSYFKDMQSAVDFCISCALSDDCSCVRLLETNEYYFESSNDKWRYKS